MKLATPRPAINAGNYVLFSCSASVPARAAIKDFARGAGSSRQEEKFNESR
jgi:hypothetical protein